MPATTAEHHGRFDIYGPPHKGLRHAHVAMLVELGKADFTRPQDELLDRLAFHLGVAERHLHEENEYIHPLLEERAPHSTSRLVTQHDEHDAYFGRLNDLMAAVRAAAPDAAVAAGKDLYLTYSQLIGMDLEHMDEEEQATWPLLCAHLSDDEMKEIVGRILQNYPPDALSYILGHMAAAITTDELAETVGGMKASMPPDAFAQLFTAAIDPRIDDPRRDHLRRLALLPG